MVGQAELDQADVAIVVADLVDETVLRVLRAMQRGSDPRTILIARPWMSRPSSRPGGRGVGLLRRGEVTAERLLEVVRRVAAGEAAVPADLLARLLDQVGRLQRQVLSPRGLSISGLSEREIEVLKLLADGLDTGEIASRLSYSERTIKAVLHDVTARFQLRSRAHAVAYAVRAGLI